MKIEEAYKDITCWGNYVSCSKTNSK